MIGFNKILIAVIVLFVSLIIAVGASTYSLILSERLGNLTQENQEAIARIEALAAELAQLKKETDKATCIAANVAREAVRETIKDSLLALVPAGTVLDEEQELRIALYNERVDDGLPFRDCSPSGIEAWLQHQPPDPALELPEID